MIGDTTHDLQMAKNANVPSVAAAYGAHPREQLMALNPLACADNPQELWQWLKTTPDLRCFCARGRRPRCPFHRR